jgi:hypothetical protein
MFQRITNSAGEIIVSGVYSGNPSSLEASFNGMPFVPILAEISDGNFVGRKIIENQIIWMDYNGHKNLTSGWSPHNYENNSYYAGCIYDLGFDYSKIGYLQREDFQQVSYQKIIQSIVGTGNLSSIKLSIQK